MDYRQYQFYLMSYQQSATKMNLLTLICLIAFTKQTQGLLKCYTCSMSENDADVSCLENPGEKSGEIRDCDKKYCYTVRQDYLDPRGKLKSLSRTCLDKPLYFNDVIEDDTYRFYYSACKKDLCNGGNGRKETNNTIGAFGDKSTIYVPGTGTRSDAAPINSTLSVVITFVMLILLQRV